jgi:hypothetical protein
MKARELQILRDNVRRLQEMCGKHPVKVFRDDYDWHGMTVPLVDIVEAVMAHCGLTLEHVAQRTEHFSVQVKKEE